MPDCKDAPPAVVTVAHQLACPKPMRRGTFSEQYLRCNKPGCPCGTSASARHGPYYRVVRVVNGKTLSRHVPGAQVDVVRAQVEAGQEFRKQVEAYWNACEEWADTVLWAPEAASEKEAAKKGGSQRQRE